MLRIISFTFFSFFCFSVSFSQSVYIKYDENCMDRFEYSSSAESVAYVSYRFDLGDGKLVQFDIGKENVKWVRELPGKIANCEALSFDKESIRRLNGGFADVYVVRESPTHYNVSKVKKAIYLDDYRSGVEVVMKDAEFVLDMSRLISNQNISKPSSEMAIFLDGTINYQCLKGYIVKKMKNFDDKAFKEYIIIPEVGIVEKRSVSKGGAMVSGRVKLGRVDKLSFDEELAKECDALQASIYDGKAGSASGNNSQASGGSSASKGVEDVPVSYDQTSPCGTVTSGHHYVNKGETLYSISRKYGVTVDQLKSWNGLGSNTISICQKLRVSSNSSSNNGGSTQKAVNEEKGGTEYAEVHVVRPGESVEALAVMYGFTEEKFRTMNNLSPFERIYAGQELRTSDCAFPEDSVDGQPAPYEEEVEIVEALDVKGNPDVYFRPIQVHHVRKNETLFSIAKQYDTTIDRVRELNGLSSNAKLSTGQKLYVQ